MLVSAANRKDTKKKSDVPNINRYEAIMIK